MKRFGRRRSSSGVTEGPTGWRANPVKRRVLMACTVVVAGLLLYFLSLKQSQSSEAVLEGTVTLDGKPLTGAFLSFSAEERSTVPTTGRQSGQVGAIMRTRYPSRTDGEGHYTVKLRPYLTYTIEVRRETFDQSPLKQKDGLSPRVEATNGTHAFNIALASPPAKP